MRVASVAGRFGRVRGRSLVVLLAAVSVLPSIGCRGYTSSTDDGVRVLVAGDPAEIQAYRDVVAAYSERDPDARILLVETAERDQLIARLSTSIAAGTPPDLFLLNYRYFGQFAARGAIEPLDDELEGSDALAGDDLYPQAVEAFSYGGEQMCLPQNISSLVVYYNRDLRRAAGLGDPSPSWSWQQMVHDAERLTADPGEEGSAEVYGLGVDPEVIRVAPFVWSNGGRLVDDEETPARFLLTEVHAVQALQAFLDLRAVHGVVPTEEEAESQDLASRFLNGDLAMILESRRVTPTFRTITDFEWDVAPLPSFSRPSTILHSDGYCLTAASDRKDEAWRFLEFALGPDGQRIAAMTGRTVPSAVAVAESDAFLDPTAPPAASRVFLDGIDHMRRVPSAAAWPEVEDAANAILEEAYYEGAEAAEVAREIERVTTPLFSRPLEP
jgi:multiple sugar transport system substrate-binding protein